MQAKVELGQAFNRAEVFLALQEARLEISRAGKDSISEDLATLKNAVRSLQAEQTALTGQLTGLNAGYESLQSLLTPLNALLPSK